MNRICLCLTGATVRQDLDLLARHAPLVHLAELRVDLLDAAERGEAWRVALSCELPLILTVRRARDGGRFEGPEPERLALMRALLDRTRARGRSFAFVDLEDDVDAHEMEESFRSGGGRVIRSRHDLAGVPPDLAAVMASLARHPSDLAKGAFHARGTLDLLSLFETGRSLDFEHILIGMGDWGFPTRVLTPHTRSYLTFASPAEVGVQAASGHSDPSTLCQLYRYPRLTASTALYAVIGNPVMHSLSPHIHNRGLRLLGLDGVYVPFQVDEVSSFVRLAELLGIRGVSVTIPHKQEIIGALATREEAVTAVGACNTLVRTPEGWRGANTDVAGFLQPLAAAGFDPAGKRATVVGAGGAARSVVYALRSKGASLLVLNRTAERARSLAAAFDCEWGALDDAGLSRIAEFDDLIVQTTSAGMGSQAAEDPIKGYHFHGREIVYDLVYSPRETRLLQRAASSGCRTVRGGLMLIAQALAQFQAFTGEEYPSPEELEEELGL